MVRRQDTNDNKEHPWHAKKFSRLCPFAHSIPVTLRATIRFICLGVQRRRLAAAAAAAGVRLVVADDVRVHLLRIQLCCSRLDGK